MPEELRDPAADRAAAIHEAVKNYEDAGLDVPKHLADLAKKLPKAKGEKADVVVTPPAPPAPTDPKPEITSDPEPELKVADKPVAKVETVEPTGPKPPSTDAKITPPPGPASSRAQRK